MPPSPLRAIAALLLLAAAGGCRDRFYTPPDGAADAPVVEGGAADGAQALALDFAVTGCAGGYDVAGARCSGAPPLALAFSPVGSAELTRFLWTFGDGTGSSTDRAPTHTYALPGDYDVTLVGAGSVGTVSRTRQRLVHVAALQAGAPCDVDGQCATGLSCFCGAGCGRALARGLCTAACSGGVCGAGTACATLPAGGTPGDGGAEATRALCLASCDADGDCGVGLACTDFPGSGLSGQPRWARVCHPPGRAAAGQPCRDADSLLADGACTTGLCADLGALGLCSATCGPGAPCPSGSACATLGDGRSLCLRACDGAQSCTRDPLLACQAAGAGGALGFTLPAGITPAAAGYCAPRRCAAQAECLPSGVCDDTGHCARR